MLEYELPIKTVVFYLFENTLRLYWYKLWMPLIDARQLSTFTWNVFDVTVFVVVEGDEGKYEVTTIYSLSEIMLFYVI